MFAATIHPTLVIRPAAGADLEALRRLAALDSRALPTGALLVAERDGELVAALGTPDGPVLADPFRPTADAVALLRLQATHAAAEAAAHARRRGRSSVGAGLRTRVRARVA